MAWRSLQRISKKAFSLLFLDEKSQNHQTKRFFSKRKSSFVIWLGDENTLNWFLKIVLIKMIINCLMPHQYLSEFFFFVLLLSAFFTLITIHLIALTNWFWNYLYAKSCPSINKEALSCVKMKVKHSHCVASKWTFKIVFYAT